MMMMMSVVRATREVNGRRETYPSHHTHPLTDCHEILHTWLRPPTTISPHKPHLVKIAPEVTSPHIAKVTTQLFFFVRKIFPRT